jgi:hypothetical protein
MIDFSLMSINKIIIHHVPNSLREQNPTLGTQLIELDAAALNELIRRITDVMGRGSNCLEMEFNDISDVSAVSQAISIMTDFSDETFIAKTTSLAQKLYQSQSNNRIPGGILVCISGRTGSNQQQYVALIKAESQSGFHISSIDSVQFLADLFLTEAQRLYKIGFLVRENINNPITPNDVSIYIFDQNATHSGTVGLANYFSQAFLGCKPMENAARQTEIFYSVTKEFIVRNPTFTDEQKVDLTNSLHTYLKNDQSAVINSQLFANTYFENPEIIDQYTSRLRHDNFPSTAVTKDISRIKTKLKVRRMKFNSGVKITFPSPTQDSDIGDLLVVDNYNEETNYTTVRIKGRIESQ